MPTIRLKVENKQVFALEEYCIVNYNNDYEVEFTFDAEWENYNVKTARFVFGGRVEDVVFEGNVCKMPMITNASNVGIGVFSGDLESTTKAHISCLKSILDERGIPSEPSNDVYNQIIDLLNKYLEQGGGGGSSSGITESEVRKIVEEVVAGEIEKLPVTIDASVDELTYAITIELKDKAGNVVSTKTLTLPIKDVDLTDYVKNTDFVYRVSSTDNRSGIIKPMSFGEKYGIITPSEAYEGYLVIRRALDTDIDKRVPSNYIDNGIPSDMTSRLLPICGANLDYAVISVLTSPKISLTDEQKENFKENFGLK